MRLVQLFNAEHHQRRIALVQEPDLQLITPSIQSVFHLAWMATFRQRPNVLQDMVHRHLTSEVISYQEVYDGRSAWKLLPAFDHPADHNRLMLSGTGLTHKASAENRQQMHEAEQNDQLTDSMQMYQWGLEGGRPEGETPGVQPEWFYKGNGSVLRAHNASLLVPKYGEDGGEEPEIAAIYIVDEDGRPWRIGLATANEFSDHVMERRNYLYLAPSKIRNCSLGPELLLTADCRQFSGQVTVYRGETPLWQCEIKSGEANMAHSLRNLEYHHFKYDQSSPTRTGTHPLPGSRRIQLWRTGEACGGRCHGGILGRPGPTAPQFTGH